MRAVAVLAAAEFRAALRNRWVAAAVGVLAGLALALAAVGTAPTGTRAVGPLTVTAVSLASLGVYLIPLLALLIAHDAIVGDVERGTMLLLLAYPVRRREILAGKFVGHVAVLGLATVLGYGAAALWLAATTTVGAAELGVFATLVASSILLGCAFLALGYLVSVAVAERATAIAAAMVLWLGTVVVYDLAVLGWLLADDAGPWTAPVLEALLLLNPVDAYRLLNLTGSADARLVSGLAGVADTTPLPLVLSLAAWTAAPLALAAVIFGRREP